MVAGAIRHSQRCYSSPYGSRSNLILLFPAQILSDMLASEPAAAERTQLADNLRWIEKAHENNLVVGSAARILYANCEGRVRLGTAFNEAIATGRLTAPVVLGRDHHDVSGTDSPYRETANIYDGR